MQLKPMIHGFAGGLAVLTIATFWTSSFVSEIFLTEAAVIEVKRSIVYYGLGPFCSTDGDHRWLWKFSDEESPKQDCAI